MELDRSGNGLRTLAEAPRETPAARISRRMVQLLKEHHGRGPTSARTYIEDDMVVVLMRGGFTRVEDTLLREGRGDAVRRQRAEFREAMCEHFSVIVAEELGRTVIACMGDAHQRPDLLAEIFVLDEPV